MSQSYQFPPSSPVLSHQDLDSDDLPIPNHMLHDKKNDYKKSQITNGGSGNSINHEYLTPMPSSSAGFGLATSPLRDVTNTTINTVNNNQLSSPIKQKEPVTLTKKKVQIKENLVVDTPIKIIKLPITSTNTINLKIGRSSLMNQIKLNPHNKLISRVHLMINYNHIEQSLQLNCIGYNGLNIVIPSFINVTKTSSKNFVIEPVDKKTNKTELNDRITNESNITNFYLLQNESFKIDPYKLMDKNILIDIRGEILLLKLEFNNNNNKKNNDKGNVSPSPVQDSSQTPGLDTIQSSPRESTPEVNTKSSDLSTLSPLNSFNSNSPPAIVQSTPHTVFATPNQTPTQRMINKSNTNSPLVKKTKLHDIKSTGSPASSHKKQKTSSSDNGSSQHQNSIEAQSPHKKNEQDEEDVNKLSSEKIDSILSEITNKEELSNILINHLAFSRLLQTPLNTLLSLNPIKLNNLDKLKLRTLLIHSVECIGVIYRQGKDAAGKQLDEEYYYIPENDQDTNRVKLVQDLKGVGASLRNCRKTHKQYFWKKPTKK